MSDAIFGVIGDIWSRRFLISTGTVAAGIGLILMGIAPGYLLLLTGVAIQGLAGGPFVGLSQASLMDEHPERHDQMMASNLLPIGLRSKQPRSIKHYYVGL